MLTNENKRRSMMRYKVSKLSKNGTAREVTTIVADSYYIKNEAHGLFDHYDGIHFYNNTGTKWYQRADIQLVAFLPGTDWIVETV
ncbi:hypothetical protein DD647_29015 [Escherichia coli]|nr:hypothetical protein DD647_29015 [Escherichia coli]